MLIFHQSLIYHLGSRSLPLPCGSVASFKVYVYIFSSVRVGELQGPRGCNTLHSAELRLTWTCFYTWPWQVFYGFTTEWGLVCGYACRGCEFLLCLGIRRKTFKGKLCFISKSNRLGILYVALGNPVHLGKRKIQTTPKLLTPTWAQAIPSCGQTARDNWSLGNVEAELLTCSHGTFPTLKLCAWARDLLVGTF